MARYRLARRAATDLNAIWRFIAQENPAAADQFLDRLYHAFVSLAHAPHIGAQRFHLAPELRLFPVREYLIFYRPIDDGVEIVRVLHGKRNITQEFFSS
jgi:toxin ParE1/3/4